MATRSNRYTCSAVPWDRSPAGVERAVGQAHPHLEGLGIDGDVLVATGGDRREHIAEPLGQDRSDRAVEAVLRVAEARDGGGQHLVEVAHAGELRLGRGAAPRWPPPRWPRSPGGPRGPPVPRGPGERRRARSPPASMPAPRPGGRGRARSESIPSSSSSARRRASSRSAVHSASERPPPTCCSASHSCWRCSAVAEPGAAGLVPRPEAVGERVLVVTGDAHLVGGGAQRPRAAARAQVAGPIDGFLGGLGPHQRRLQATTGLGGRSARPPRPAGTTTR